MNRDPANTVAFRQLHGGNGVLVDRVYATCSHQSHQMQRRVTVANPGAKLDEFGYLVEISRPDGVGDTDDVLRNDAARSEVQVTDFTVAHLATRQAHRFGRGIQQCEGRRFDDAIPHGRAAECDGVAVGWRSVPPAIQYDQHDRSATL